MKKTGFILLAISAVVAGLLIGTLNSDPVNLDLLWFQSELPLGLALLIGFSIGVVTGLGIIYLGRVVPLRLQLRKARIALARQDGQGIDLPDD